MASRARLCVAAAWCLADIDPDGHPALSDSGERYLLSAARRLGAAAGSLVVSRNLSEAQGRQQFVPARHLRGLLPAALLEEYAFWQSGDGDLYGDAKAGAKHPRTMIHCRLLESDGDGAGVAGERAAVIRRRIPLPPGCEPGTSRERSRRRRVGPAHAGGPAVRAGDARRAAEAESAYDERLAGKTFRRATASPAATALRSLAGRLAAVEGLAHCLAWTAAPVDVDKLSRRGGVLGALGRRGRRGGRDGVAAVGDGKKLGSGLVRLWDRPPGAPRLGISFSRGGARAAKSQEISTKLECEEHAGLFLSARRSPALDALLSGLPHALVLEARDGGLRVLLPAGAAPRPALDRVVEVAEGGGDPKPEKKESKQKDLAVVAAEEAAAVGTKGFGADAVLDRWDHAWIKNARAGAGRALRVPGAQLTRRAGRDHASPRRCTCACCDSWRGATPTCANSRTCACVSRGRRPRRRSCGRRSPA